MFQIELILPNGTSIEVSVRENESHYDIAKRTCTKFSLHPSVIDMIMNAIKNNFNEKMQFQEIKIEEEDVEEDIKE